MSSANAANAEVRTLAVYDRIADPMTAIAALGKDIARSQMFGCSNEEQGRVLAMTCFAKRMDPMSIAERYHLFQNRLSMRADAMLAGLHERNGSHRIICRTPEAAEIEITFASDTQRFSLTWEDAQKEPFVWCKEKNGKRPLKDNWATPRSRMQMLWARVVSDGVRAMCPGVVCGSYAPEEIADMSEGSVPAGSVVIDAEIEEVSQDIKQEVQQEVKQEENDEYATADQVTRITDLYVDLKVPYEAQQAALEKRGVNSLRSLRFAEAAELLHKLEYKMLAKARSEGGTEAGVDTSSISPDATSIDVSGPATQAMIDQVKQLIGEIAQNGQPDIAKRVKEKLESHRLAKLADLSVAEIGKLQAALSMRNLKAFFELVLSGHSGHSSRSSEAKN